MIENIKEEVKLVTDPVQELLAKVGEAEILRRLMIMGDVVKGKVPLVIVKTEVVEGTERAVVKIDNDTRRLILDPEFGWMWYDAEPAT